MWFLHIPKQISLRHVKCVKPFVRSSISLVALHSVRRFCSGLPSLSKQAPNANDLLQNIRNDYNSKNINQPIPMFNICGDNVDVITAPTDFYNRLKSGISTAKKSITLAALYLGYKEGELVSLLRAAMSYNQNLSVHILLDCLRGTRSHPNSSVGALLPLLRDFPDQISLSLYHSPHLSGIKKAIAPERFNESVGVLHFKIFSFDDDLILSGANLNRDYFTNRQDRYFHFRKSPEISQYFSDLVATISKFSYFVTPTAEMYRLNSPAIGLDPVEESKLFIAECQSQMEQFLKKWNARCMEEERNPGKDTMVMPLLQMGPFGVRQEEGATLNLLRFTSTMPTWTIHLASGYFNLAKEFAEAIVKSGAKFRILTAAPEANGFYLSKGVSKYIPSAYTYLESQFYQLVKSYSRLSEITINEYNRPCWTFHAKGLWLCEDAPFPKISTIGSSNYGYRSLRRDLEGQVMLSTENENLQRQLNSELSELYQYSNTVGDDTFQLESRKVHWLTKVAVNVLKTMF